jgi:hypothetical protein
MFLLLLGTTYSAAQRDEVLDRQGSRGVCYAYFTGFFKCECLEGEAKSDDVWNLKKYG